MARDMVLSMDRSLIVKGALTLNCSSTARLATALDDALGQDDCCAKMVSGGQHAIRTDGRSRQHAHVCNQYSIALIPDKWWRVADTMQTSPEQCSDPSVSTISTAQVYKDTIRTLHAEGAIMPWSGPAHSHNSNELSVLSIPATTAERHRGTGSSGHSETTAIEHSPTHAEPRVATSPAEQIPNRLSVLSTLEEAYVSLSPQYLSCVLANAITVAPSELFKGTDHWPPPKWPLERPTAIVQLRQQLWRGEQVHGLTTAKLLSWLQQINEQWERLTIRLVEEALEWGKDEGFMVQCTTHYRWTVSPSVRAPSPRMVHLADALLIRSPTREYGHLQMHANEPKHSGNNLRNAPPTHMLEKDMLQGPVKFGFLTPPEITGLLTELDQSDLREPDQMFGSTITEPNLSLVLGYDRSLTG
ncbi:hypothetical protein C8Q76DRAFT_698794 [Earliella scabrosa]|nr:hypothetical protein C8Q76DRAFT_698794 [Earliella scabrosa]